MAERSSREGRNGSELRLMDKVSHGSFALRPLQLRMTQSPGGGGASGSPGYSSPAPGGVTQ